MNGRVFVNNVSFGVYAAIVQSDEYRDAKLNTAAKMLPELLGPDYDPFDFELDGPTPIAGCDPDLILVSNNVYKLEGIGGLGTRARLDEGVLGVIVVEVRNGGGARAARLAVDRRSGLRVLRMARVDARPRSRCGRASRSTPASTARRSPSTRRCGSRSSPARCASASPRIIPGVSPARVAERGAGRRPRVDSSTPRSAPDGTCRRAVGARPAG